MRALSLTRNIVRVTTVVSMAVAVIVATADGFAQSYSGLYRWGLEHELSGWKAQSFPLLVDIFVFVGEMGMFLLALDSHKLRKNLLSWVDLILPAFVASLGWGVSLWFNVGHVKTSDFDTKVTAGVPPVTAMIGLVILLRTVHRYMTRYDAEPAGAPETAAETPEILPVLEPGTLQFVPEHAARVELDALPADPPAIPPAPATRPDWSPSGAITKTATETNTDESDPLIARYMGHELWARAIKLYTESLDTPGKPLSQRSLAEALGMRNRQLATAAMSYVRRERGMI